MMERLVLLGLPLAGACLILASGVAIPIGQPAVSVISLVGLVILVPAVVYLLLPLLPIPGIIFPRWARDIRSRRAQMNAAFDARARQDPRRPTP